MKLLSAKVRKRVSLAFSLEVWKFYIYVSILCKLFFVQSVTFFSIERFGWFGTVFSPKAFHLPHWNTLFLSKIIYFLHGWTRRYRCYGWILKFHPQVCLFEHLIVSNQHDFVGCGYSETDPQVDVGCVGANLAPRAAWVSPLFTSWANKMWASHNASKPPLPVTKATSGSSQTDRLTSPSKLGVQRNLYSIVSICLWQSQEK